MYWGNGGITQCILNLGTRQRWVVNFIHWLLYPWGRSPWYPSLWWNGTLIHSRWSVNHCWSANSSYHYIIYILLQLKNLLFPFSKKIVCVGHYFEIFPLCLLQCLIAWPTKWLERKHIILGLVTLHHSEMWSQNCVTKSRSLEGRYIWQHFKWPCA